MRKPRKHAGDAAGRAKQVFNHGIAQGAFSWSAQQKALEIKPRCKRILRALFAKAEWKEKDGRNLSAPIMLLAYAVDNSCNTAKHNIMRSVFESKANIIRAAQNIEDGDSRSKHCYSTEISTRAFEKGDRLVYDNALVSINIHI